MIDGLLNPVYGVAAMAVALLAAHVAGRWVDVETRGRNVPLDGLRGYMAFGVFLYHSTIWYDYLRTGTWAEPAASFYRPVGDLCVKVFFMITAYLFVGKIIDAKRRPIDWLGLYVSRVLRLVPLYAVAVVVLVAMALALTGWTLREPLVDLLEHIGHWAAFTMVHTPDINRLPDTSLLIAGVTWTLGYEWLFYFSLPLIALVMRRRVPVAAVVACMAIFIGIVAVKPGVIVPWSFVVGAAAAFVARMPQIADRLRGPLAGLVVVAAAVLADVVQGFHGSKGRALVLLALVFVPIACGNRVFGVLTNRAALLLGEASYGLYLLHGLLLSFVIEVVVGPAWAKTLTPAAHWALVTAIGVILVALASLTFRTIERPAMQSASRWTQRLEQFGASVARRRKA